MALNVEGSPNHYDPTMLLISSLSPRLVGFCDASAKAYAAVVYLRVGDESCVNVKLTRVTPIIGVTIPRLELLCDLS